MVRETQPRLNSLTIYNKAVLVTLLSDTSRTDEGYTCVTNKIFKNMDVTSYTPWILCGKSGYSSLLLRTPTGSSTTLPDLPATRKFSSLIVLYDHFFNT